MSEKIERHPLGSENGLIEPFDLGNQVTVANTVTIFFEKCYPVGLIDRMEHE